MLDKQRIILIVAFALLLLSELFPPWTYVDKASSVRHPAGFHFIFSPDPQIESFTQIKQEFSLPEHYLPEYIELGKDTGHLNMQRASLLLFMFGLSMLLDERKPFARIFLASTLLFFALLIMSAWIFFFISN